MLPHFKQGDFFFPFHISANGKLKYSVKLKITVEISWSHVLTSTFSLSLEILGYGLN